MPSFNIIESEDVFQGIYHMRAWSPSWSCYLDHYYKFFTLTTDAQHEIGLYLLCSYAEFEANVSKNGYEHVYGLGRLQLNPFGHSFHIHTWTIVIHLLSL